MEWFFLCLATLLALYLTGVSSFRLLLLRFQVFHSKKRPRLARYLLIFFNTWLLVICLAFLCSGLNWSPNMLGLRIPTNLSLAGLFVLLWLLFLLGMILLQRWFMQRFILPNDELRSDLRLASAIFPRTTRERILFAILAFNAGLCEELLFRGFLPIYLIQIFPHLPFFWAIVVAACSFGIAHISSGPKKKLEFIPVIGNGILGLIYGLLYLRTGSLFLPIVFHALLDLRALWLNTDDHSDTTSSLADKVTL